MVYKISFIDIKNLIKIHFSFAEFSKKYYLNDIYSHFFKSLPKDTQNEYNKDTDKIFNKV